jgi:hypothetical protein
LPRQRMEGKRGGIAGQRGDPHERGFGKMMPDV